jgi:hypothetical protein
MAKLSFIEERRLKKLFRMEDGYVLTFSNTTFKDFIIDSVERDIESGQYDDVGTSKAKRLWCFWTIESDYVVGKLIYDLIEIVEDENPAEDTLVLVAQCSQIAERLLQDVPKDTLPLIAENLGATTKDFFVSYNSADAVWAEWIAWVLEEKGYSVVIQAWDFRPGGNFILDMQRAATETWRTVMVLSENYLNALYTQPEWAAVFNRDPASLARKLLPIRITPCKPTGMLATVSYIDFVGVTEPGAEELLLAALQERAKPSTRPTFPRSVPPVDRIIPSVATFPSTPRSGIKAIEDPTAENSCSNPLPRKLSAKDRLTLIQTLSSLPSAQFDEIIFSLNPPSGNMPGSSSPQASRTTAFLVWLESPIGPGLEELESVLEGVLAAQSQTTHEPGGRSQNNELLRDLINELKKSQTTTYDLRGSTFGGGFAETVQGDQK